MKNRNRKTHIIKYDDESNLLFKIISILFYLKLSSPTTEIVKQIYYLRENFHILDITWDHKSVKSLKFIRLQNIHSKSFSRKKAYFKSRLLPACVFKRDAIASDELLKSNGNLQKPNAIKYKSVTVESDRLIKTNRNNGSSFVRFHAHWIIKIKRGQFV